MKKICTSLVVMVLGLAINASASEPPKWGLESLMKQLSEVEESRSKFSEVRHDPLLKRPLYMKGILKYQAPDYIRKETLKPYYNQFAVQGNKLTVTREGARPKTIKIQKHPALWAFVEAFRATLSGNLKNLKRFYTVGFTGRESRWLMTLQPLNRRMKKRVHEIRISGRKNTIKSIEIIGVAGDRSTMTILAQ